MSTAGLIYSASAANNMAESQQAAAEQQAQAAKAAAETQAAEYYKQAKVADYQAGVAQMAGDREAERVSAQLAQDVGATYATVAGNGLMVDGNGNDTLGAALRTEARNAAADISTIRDNTAMNVWNYQVAAAQNRRSAGTVLKHGANTAAGYITQGNAAVASGTNTAIGSYLSILPSAASEVNSYLGVANNIKKLSE